VLFPTHLVIGGLAGKGRLPLLWTVAGAALPDVVDKPLAMAGVTPLFHSVVHSALFGIGLAALLLVVRRSGRPAAVRAVSAVTVGWGSHLGADATHLVLNGRPENTVFLLWPLVASWDSIEAGPVPFVVRYLWTPSFCVEIAIWLVAGYLLLRDGLPEGVPQRA
jgi:uncharacterized membrane protein